MPSVSKKSHYFHPKINFNNPLTLTALLPKNPHRNPFGEISKIQTFPRTTDLAPLPDQNNQISKIPNPNIFSEKTLQSMKFLRQRTINSLQ
jgi:hypothetical protein